MQTFIGLMIAGAVVAALLVAGLWVAMRRIGLSQERRPLGFAALARELDVDWERLAPAGLGSTLAGMVRSCQACRQAARCEADLAAGRADTVVRYCPNALRLAAFRRMQG